MRKNYAKGLNLDNIICYPHLLYQPIHFQSCYDATWKRCFAHSAIKSPDLTNREVNLLPEKPKIEISAKEKEERAILSDSIKKQFTSTPASVIKQIFRNKWGVKLVENVKSTSESNEDLEQNPSQNLKEEHSQDVAVDAMTNKKMQKLRMALISKHDENLGEPLVKRDSKVLFEVKGITESYMHEANEVLNHEYYVPAEVRLGEVAAAWKKIAVNSTVRDVNSEVTTPARLKEVESIFIRPEPPAKQKDEQS